MNRKKAIKEYNKVKKKIGKIIAPIKSLDESSVELLYIASKLKSKKQRKELTEISINLRNSLFELLSNTNSLFDSYERLGVTLFHHPYFP